MKKLFKTSVLILAAATILAFSGCIGNNADDMTVYEIPTQECVLQVDIGAEIYTYSDKLEVYMTTDDYADTLSINCGTEEKKDWKEILSGNFLSVVWRDYKYFVFCDNMYYEFDIKNYNIPTEYDDGVEYELKEYTKEEFAEAYPDYESFNWNQPFLDNINKIPVPMN